MVVTSDHGESFGAEKTNDHDPSDHGTSLYREQAAVPLFVVFPGKVAPGQQVARSVSIRQIPATIAHLLGLRGSPFPGEPFPIDGGVEDASPRSDSSVLAELKGLDSKVIAESVVEGHWHYLHHLDDRGGVKKGEELYAFADDPLEKKNLAAAPESQVTLVRMRDELKRLLTTGSAQSGVGPTTAEDEGQTIGNEPQS